MMPQFITKCILQGLKIRKKENPELEKLFDLLDRFLCFLNRRLYDLAVLFVKLHSLKESRSFLVENSEVVNFETYLELLKRTGGFRTVKLPLESIRNLIKAHHTIDTAIKVRFNILAIDQDLPHQEAFDRISDELKKLGLDPSKILPDEVKTLADRARRYKDKLREEAYLLSVT